MAKLDDYLSDDVNEKAVSKKRRNNIFSYNSGKKRRVWLDEATITEERASLNDNKVKITKPLLKQTKEIKNIKLSELRGVPLKIILYFFSRVQSKDTYETEKICMKQII